MSKQMVEFKNHYTDNYKPDKILNALKQLGSDIEVQPLFPASTEYSMPSPVITNELPCSPAIGSPFCNHGVDPPFQDVLATREECLREDSAGK